MPHGVNYCRLQLLFIVSDLTDLIVPQGTDIQWTLPLFPFVGLVADAACEALHHHRVSFQNPAQSQIAPGFSRGLECITFRLADSMPCYAASTSCFSGRFISFNIFWGSYFTPVVSIVYITLSSLQAITINDCIFFSGFSDRVV